MTGFTAEQQARLGELVECKRRLDERAAEVILQTKQAMREAGEPVKDVTRLDYAEVILTRDGCYSRFHDASTWGSQPHDTPHYDEIAERCGYLTPRRDPSQPIDAWKAEARIAYCREHEVCHHVVGAVFYKGPSPVLYALAHGRDVTPEAAALEEAMVMTLQRWLRAGERPIIGGVDWDAIKLRLALLLDA